MEKPAVISSSPAGNWAEAGQGIKQGVWAHPNATQTDKPSARQTSFTTPV
jgi:hypothetical protein